MSTEQETHYKTEEAITTRKPNILVRVAVIAGMLIILFFVAGVIVNFVPKLLGKMGTASVSLSSFFTPKAGITVTAEPTRVESGKDIKISWKNNSTDTEGKMIWSFDCVEKVVIQYDSISGKKEVKCDTNFPLPSTGSYSFTAINNGSEEVTVPMSVSLYDAEVKNVKISGTSSFGIIPKGYELSNTNSNNDYNDTGTTTPVTNNNSNNNNSNNNSQNTQNNNSNTTTNTRPQNTNAGIADLSISAVSIGGVSSNGSYKANSVDANDKVLFKFRVSNIGSGRSGTWQLRGTLPTKIASEQVYYSPTQPQIAAGDSYELSMSFDSYDPSIRSITLVISGGDNNTSNNTMTLAVPYTGTTNGGGSQTGSRADLSTRITDVGIMDNNDRFYSASSLNEDDKIAVKFEIENLGGTSTGSWRFKIDMPTDDDNVFYSGTQSSLAPGQKVQFTFGFDNPDVGTNEISIEADYDDDINENNENNNDDSISIRVNR